MATALSTLIAQRTAYLDGSFGTGLAPDERAEIVRELDGLIRKARA